MCCDIYFRQAIHSSRSGRVFIKSRDFGSLIPFGNTETKTEQEGDSDGN